MNPEARKELCTKCPEWKKRFHRGFTYGESEQPYIAMAYCGLHPDSPITNYEINDTDSFSTFKIPKNCPFYLEYTLLEGQEDEE